MHRKVRLESTMPCARLNYSYRQYLSFLWRGMFLGSRFKPKRGPRRPGFGCCLRCDALYAMPSRKQRKVTPDDILGSARCCFKMGRLRYTVEKLKGTGPKV
ncbi:hypothetical protein JMJ77_0002978 [Colletotrichum scovillei]|uniref:Uncharacterized protein n=1 Tax=Colletotrichum scovillei TaxID=1209932 RepID=A0A9P7UCP7_9PEZI|nr:hypothetical protein JMJ78_0006188 [Colletotrichum scovillei]KAG7043272.1 hypothetical protein JMJ77_0002978 [Colletotrichum scovillei]KAG7062719.1 hypothetical protein JMJ76_0009562 [Colletotrichum scovillei]